MSEEKISDEIYEYSKINLKIVLDELLMKSNSHKILKFDSNDLVLSYCDLLKDYINVVLEQNKLTLDTEKTIRGSKRTKYYKERLQLIINRIMSRLEENKEYDNDNFDNFVEFINNYIYQIGSDYDIELIDIKDE